MLLVLETQLVFILVTLLDLRLEENLVEFTRLELNNFVDSAHIWYFATAHCCNLLGLHACNFSCVYFRLICLSLALSYSLYEDQNRSSVSTAFVQTMTIFADTYCIQLPCYFTNVQKCYF